MPAAMIVRGEATPAVSARNANPKKKLIAGPMLAIVAAAMSTMPSEPDRNLSGSFPGSAGDFDSWYTGLASVWLMSAPFGPCGSRRVTPGGVCMGWGAVGQRCRPAVPDDSPFTDSCEN